jgi:hypothetical protein
MLIYFVVKGEKYNKKEHFFLRTDSKIKFLDGVKIKILFADKFI